MNPGFLAWIIVCMTLILYFSGWKEELIGSLSHRGFLIFIIGWMIMVPHQLQLTPRIFVNAAFVWSILGVLCLGCWYVHVRIGSWIQFISMALFLASAAAMLRQIFLFDPLFIIYRPGWDIAFIMGVLAVLMTRQPVRQIALLTSGWLIAECLQLISMRGGPNSITLGGAGSQDVWWFSLVFARLFSQAFVFGIRTCKMAAHSLHQLISKK